jgi:adenine-specific DNA methylase
MSRQTTDARNHSAAPLPAGLGREAVAGLRPEKSALESPSFPFERLSEVAELESWRKEVNRPIYHLHKWWAQRLGSVFRAILIGALSPEDADVMDLFYRPARFPESVVFDPFMGSGTTVGEALKLGARAVGRDINPVAHFAVRNALSKHTREEVLETFNSIRRDVQPAIRHFYSTELPDGRVADVLYYFWVKVVDCPGCGQGVDLFSSYVFAQNAYPSRKPEARVLCPLCGEVNVAKYDAASVTCGGCRGTFDPRSGPAHKTTATCRECSHSFQIAKTVRLKDAPLAHRMYAKLVLLPEGTKTYLKADARDLALYAEALERLRARENAFPVVPIEPGYNTDQAINYNYRHWHQMFNDRQLLCLSLLAERIRAVEGGRLRELFTCLFSGALEFNNMFASYKGEGTGAVRHMFSHHILKPERTPLEANPWGTPKSSGSFSTLFESRLLRALDYRRDPFEVRPVRKDGKVAGEKVYGLSCALGHEAAGSSSEFGEGKSLYLSCGDSSRTDLADESVDAVVTDPPFFDNVHYSQLADFFHLWQRHVLGGNGHHAGNTTRSAAEVQTGDPAAFAERLGAVWAECHRVLRPGGLLVFTYHHSRPEGWWTVLDALSGAGFYITATHPVKSEMSVAVPKSQAKEPIDLDVIIVCRKREGMKKETPDISAVVTGASREAAAQVKRFGRVGRRLSRNDVRVVLKAQVIKHLSRSALSAEVLAHLDSSQDLIDDAIEHIYQNQATPARATTSV